MNPDGDEVSLLDMLLVVAENLRLLVLGPLVVGALAWAFAYFLPQNYTSEAMLAFPIATANQAAAVMVSPLVLDPIIESLHLLDGHPMQVARLALAKQLKTTVGKDGFLRLEVTAQSPYQAQTIANAVIDTWLKTTMPGEQSRADLQKRLSYAQTSLDAVTRLIARLDAGGGANLNKPLNRGDAGTTLVSLGELQARYLGEVLSIPRELQGVSREVVKQPPTLPTEPVSPKKSLIAALAALAAGFVLLLWVFVQNAWRTSVENPLTAEKCRKLVAAVGVK